MDLTNHLCTTLPSLTLSLWYGCWSSEWNAWCCCSPRQLVSFPCCCSKLYNLLQYSYTSLLWWRDLDLLGSSFQILLYTPKLLLLALEVLGINWWQCLKSDKLQEELYLMLLLLTKSDGFLISAKKKDGFLIIKGSSLLLVQGTILERKSWRGWLVWCDLSSGLINASWSIASFSGLLS